MSTESTTESIAEPIPGRAARLAAYASLHASPDLDLALLPLDILWDMWAPEAREAVETRMHAFHEAGHIWAAYRGLARPDCASHFLDGDVLVGRDETTTRWIAAMGPVVQGLLVEADGIRVDEGVAPLVPLTLLHRVEEFDGWQIREHLECVCGDCCCRRGGDEVAREHLGNEVWIERNLVSVIVDWTRIQALALALLSGDALDAAAIDALMSIETL